MSHEFHDINTAPAQVRKAPRGWTVECVAAECWPDCRDRLCPYRHTSSFYVLDADGVLVKGPLETLGDATAYIRAFGAAP